MGIVMHLYPLKYTEIETTLEQWLLFYDKGLIYQESITRVNYHVLNIAISDKLSKQ